MFELIRKFLKVPYSFVILNLFQDPLNPDAETSSA